MKKNRETDDTPSDLQPLVVCVRYPKRCIMTFEWITTKGTKGTKLFETECIFFVYFVIFVVQSSVTLTFSDRHDLKRDREKGHGCINGKH